MVVTVTLVPAAAGQQVPGRSNLTAHQPSANMVLHGNPTHPTRQRRNREVIRREPHVALVNRAEFHLYLPAELD